MNDRVLKNGPEQLFTELARSMGWKFSKRGWPDFLCRTSDGSFVAVEVKPRMKSRPGLQLLKREQAQTMDFLTSLGVKCFVSDGVTLEPYDQSIHSDESRRYSRHRTSGER